jgi:hypothetical protein
VSPAPVLTPDERRDLADRAGAAYMEAQRAKPAIKAWETLRPQVQALFDTEPKDKDFKLRGAKYELMIGPRENQRKITSMRKLAKALKDAFFDHCAVPLKIIDVLLPGEKQKGLIVEDRTGSRPVEAVTLPTPEEKAA